MNTLNPKCILKQTFFVSQISLQGFHLQNLNQIIISADADVLILDSDARVLSASPIHVRSWV